MKLSDYVIRFLYSSGIRRIFMLTGGGCMHLVDSVGRQEGLEYICCLHEQACAFAAQAHAEFTSEPSAVLVTNRVPEERTPLQAWRPLGSTPLHASSSPAKSSVPIRCADAACVRWDHRNLTSSPLSLPLPSSQKPSSIRTVLDLELEKAPGILRLQADAGRSGLRFRLMSNRRSSMRTRLVGFVAGTTVA